MATKFFSKSIVKIGLLFIILNFSYFAIELSFSNYYESLVPIEGKINTFSADSPIFINGNIELASFSSSGNGTQENPYIIENYFITNSNIHGNGLEIINTDKFFILRGIIVENTNQNGIHIENVTNGRIENNKAYSNLKGFYFLKSSNLTVSKNYAFETGLYFENSNYNNISNNLVENSFNGYSFYSSNNNIFSNNFAENDITGLHLIESNGNIISKNIFNQSLSAFVLSYSHNNNIETNFFLKSEFEALKFSFSSNNTIIDNIFEDKGISFFGKIVSDVNQKLVLNNTIMTKPILYLHQMSNKTIMDNFGQIILVNCSSIAITDQNISFASKAIQILFSNDITIIGNNIKDNYNGIYFLNSNNNKIVNNLLEKNIQGFIFEKSYSNYISNNVANDNSISGFYFLMSFNNTIESNLAKSNKYSGYQNRGFIFDYSDNNFIIGNIASDNSQDGFRFVYSNQNSIVMCTSNSNFNGFYLEYSHLNQFEFNEANQNYINGLYLFHSNESVIKNNTIFDNQNYGIYLEKSGGNLIYLNSFSSYQSHKSQAFSDTNTNIWDVDEFGNYWSNYNGFDTNNDYIGDTPYEIDGSNLSVDHNPLMNSNNGEIGQTITATSQNSSSSVSFVTSDSSNLSFLSIIILIIIGLGGFFLYTNSKHKSNLEKNYITNKLNKSKSMNCTDCGSKIEQFDLFRFSCGRKLV
jgi:parallel beta-helix repeat protein